MSQLKKKPSPVKLKPAFQNYLWGGTNLRDLYHKNVPKGWRMIAESWELSTHENGLSLIDSGDFAGKTLKSYLEYFGPKVLGKRFQTATLPILFKIIDAKKDLSVQVHPDDDYAYKYEGQAGKTEVWYILQAKPKSRLYCGFKKKIDKKEFSQRIKNNTLTEVLQSLEAKKGDVFFIPAGTIHAIGKGIVLAEVQQNSDLTYRLYDYGRKDAQGKTRPLHIDKGLEVIDLTPGLKNKKFAPIPLKSKTHITTLANSPYFVVKSLTIDKGIELLVLDDTYQALFVVKGNFVLHYQDQKFPLSMGETIFLPADLGTYFLQGKGEVLLITDN